MNQLSIKAWPKGLCWEVAKINLEPDNITAISGIKFEQDYDDLDRFQAAIIVAPWGREFALERHICSPVPGTKIIFFEGLSDGKEELMRVLTHLKVSSQHLTWINPNLS